MRGVKEIMPAVATFMGLSAVIFHGVRNMKLLGGEVPTTLNESWADATIKLSAAKPREGCADTIPMDPFTNGYPHRFTVTGDGEWVLRQKMPKRSKSMSYLHGYDKPQAAATVYDKPASS